MPQAGRPAVLELMIHYPGRTVGRGPEVLSAPWPLSSRQRTP